MENQPPVVEKPRPAERSNQWGKFLSIAAWLPGMILAAVAVFLAWRLLVAPTGSPPEIRSITDKENYEIIRRPNKTAALPNLAPPEPSSSIFRRPDLRTIIPTRPREEVITYTVQTGDSVFEIAEKFNLTPESVLWGNYALLNDNPDLISVGMELRIPPTDGVLYVWQADDSLLAVAQHFSAESQDILNWPGNDVDLVNPEISVGKLILIPGGQREFRQWLIPTIPRGSAGVASSVYGGGACAGSYEGAYGTGTFIWPTTNHILSGNDFWSGHLAIDIAAGDGAAILASDSGVVVFAGWANGGYGNTAIIDHGNGYQTLYAHMSSVTARCGQSVIQGGTVGVAGSTGNSTGTHLHFEVRYLGGFISPWYVLPAP